MRVVLVDGLHMHRLPDRSAFCVVLGQCLQNLRRTALAVFMYIVRRVIIPCLLTHRVFVDNHTAEPKVRYHFPFNVRAHLYRQILQSFLVSVIDRSLHIQVLLEMQELASAYTGNDVAHAVVVAEFSMLVPRCCIPGLRGPLPGLLRCFLIIRQQHSPGTAGNDLVAVEGDDVVFAEAAGHLSLVYSTQRLCRVLNQHCTVLVADRLDFIQLRRCTVQVGNDDRLSLRIQFKALLQCFRIHVPGLILTVHKYSNALFIRNRIHRCAEGHIGAQHIITGTDSGKLYRQMDR